jgi:hypothetical protein
MTIINQSRSERIEGVRADRLWDALQQDWAGSDPQKWKWLAGLHLRMHCRWELPMLARALGHRKGHIARMLHQTLADLQTQYAQVRLADVPVWAWAAPKHLQTAATVDLDEQIDACRDELRLWELLKRQQQRGSVMRVAASPRPQVVPGSLRDRIARYLEQAGPSRACDIARGLDRQRTDVLPMLRDCPEFVSNTRGQWSLQPFEGHAALGPDVELIG